MCERVCAAAGVGGWGKVSAHNFALDAPKSLPGPRLCSEISRTDNVVAKRALFIQRCKASAPTGTRQLLPVVLASGEEGGLT